MDLLINLKGESIHNAYVYQSIMSHTLNILQIFRWLYTNKAEKKFHKKSECMGTVLHTVSQYKAIEMNYSVWTYIPVENKRIF